MLSIFARSFMIATQTDERSAQQNLEQRTEDNWWKKTTRASRSCSK